MIDSMLRVYTWSQLASEHWFKPFPSSCTSARSLEIIIRVIFTHVSKVNIAIDVISICILYNLQARQPFCVCCSMACLKGPNIIFGTAASLQKQKQLSHVKFSSYAAMSGSTLCRLRGRGLVLVEALALEEPPRVPPAVLR